MFDAVVVDVDEHEGGVVQLLEPAVTARCGSDLPLGDLCRCGSSWQTSPRARCASSSPSGRSRPRLSRTRYERPLTASRRVTARPGDAEATAERGHRPDHAVVGEGGRRRPGGTARLDDRLAVAVARVVEDERRGRGGHGQDDRPPARTGAPTLDPVAAVLAARAERGGRAEMPEKASGPAKTLRSAGRRNRRSPARSAPRTFGPGSATRRRPGRRVRGGEHRQ